MISNCGHDEKCKYTGGEAGDQTGNEWEIRPWYNRPWKCILRHPDSRVTELLAEYAEKAAKNDNIGYDMYQRLTYWQALSLSDYDPANIKVKCETDCSAGVAANVRAIGYKLNIDALKAIDINSTTWTLRKQLQKAGFKILTAKKYLTSENYLERGDILLNDEAHVAINLTNGKNVTTTFEKIQNGEHKKTNEEVAKDVISGKYGNFPERKTKLEAEGYNYEEIQLIVNKMIDASKPSSNTYEVYGLNTYLNVRKGPGTSYSIVGKLYNGNRVNVVEIVGKWAKLDNGNYISTGYIKKV